VRIHWSVVIVCVILTILITWHLRTSHLDFMKPRGVDLGPEDFGATLATGAIGAQPNLDGSTPNSEVLGNPEEQDAPVIAEITEQELGDLEASPGLDSYLEFGLENSPERLLELSSSLRARGQFQRALLVFERIIDTTKANAEALNEAATGISSITPSLPSWSIDPSSEISLMLHIGTAHPASEELKKSILEVATLIRKSSGDQLEILPKIPSTRQGNAQPDSPITLWISTADDAPIISTPVMTFRTPNDQEMATHDISYALFQTVRANLEKLGYPAPPELEASGRNLLSFYISRLMWRDFALALYNPPNPEDEKIEEEDKN